MRRRAPQSATLYTWSELCRLRGHRSRRVGTRQRARLLAADRQSPGGAVSPCHYFDSSCRRLQIGVCTAMVTVSVPTALHANRHAERLITNVPCKSLASESMLRPHDGVDVHGSCGCRTMSRLMHLRTCGTRQREIASAVTPGASSTFSSTITPPSGRLSSRTSSAQRDPRPSGSTLSRTT